MTLSFTVSPTDSQFSPRIGTVTHGSIQIQTPGIITTTSRGVIPHLSLDNVLRTPSIQWIHVPFESFLEHSPPVPTLLPPLRDFLRFSPSKHLLSMSLRDISSAREMPPNTNGYVTANTVRGVRRVSPKDYKSYAELCKPDIVFALGDNAYPSTNASGPNAKLAAGMSQKRGIKSVERTLAWLGTLLNDQSSTTFVSLVGGASLPARSAFANGLVETLYGPEAEQVSPLKTLDEGVSGYVLELVPMALEAKATPAPDSFISLIQSSLGPLPMNKPRLVFGGSSSNLTGNTSTNAHLGPVTPQTALLLTLHCGIDLFDSRYAEEAASVGVALGFRFPAPAPTEGKEELVLPLGWNLYDIKYRMDFSSVGSSPSGSGWGWRGVVGTFEDDPKVDGDVVCLCPTCSPLPPNPEEVILHSVVDSPPSQNSNPERSHRHRPPYTRAYIHHLLHTHEMSAHALLKMHNLHVWERFWDGVRGVLSDGEGNSANVERFKKKVERFIKVYSDKDVMNEAREMWAEVEVLRGKGRLAREKEREVKEVQKKAGKDGDSEVEVGASLEEQVREKLETSLEV
ncbi:hypothetical protein VKT23_001353 [Stygiomarasmius scandens]|uniref:tRNA-guanine(15) transglycosylase-like domain-containing protein n=1 Tax=Marasmiellus scandens TaxID=2682957 RepID=A0ABR1K9G2_9AGAR